MAKAVNGHGAKYNRNSGVTAMFGEAAAYRWRRSGIAAIIGCIINMAKWQ